MNAPMQPAALKHDLDSRDQIERFVRRFYGRLLKDPVLAPIFLDVAAVDLSVHLPHIVDYWAKLLLGESGYRRHTMNIHRRLHGRQALEPADFDRWLGYFVDAVDSGWEGPCAERAKRVAEAIARNMRQSLLVTN